MQRTSPRSWYGTIPYKVRNCSIAGCVGDDIFPAVYRFMAPESLLYRWALKSREER